MSFPNFAEREFKVECHECSRDDLIFPSVLTGDFQEVAEDGVFDYGMDTPSLKENGFCWIILRMSVEMDRFPAWKEDFKIRTWGCGARGVFWRRDYAVFDKENKEIGRASSEWIVANDDNHGPVRPNQVEAVFKDKSEGKILEPQWDRLAFDYSAPKLRFPSDDTSPGDPVITKFADYSELDHNDHVNNTRYIAWAYDALFKLGVDLRSVKKFDINYHAEVLSGEKVDLYYSKDDGFDTIYGYKGDGTKVFIFKCR